MYLSGTSNVLVLTVPVSPQLSPILVFVMDWQFNGRHQNCTGLTLHTIRYPNLTYRAITSKLCYPWDLMNLGISLWILIRGEWTQSFFFYYHKIPKICPSMYSPLQIQAPQKPSPPPRVGVYLEFALKYKVKQCKNGKSPSHYKLTQSILKRKCPSLHTSLRI